MEICKDIRYVGVNDHQVDLFEGLFPVPDGMAYNSYVILDEKCAVMDSVDYRFAGTWLENVAAALGQRQPDYLIVQHMEPDHGGSVAEFMARYPQAVLVASAKAFVMIKQFFGQDYAGRRLEVGEGDTLALGRHSLTFLTAPMVHWPEVIVSYDAADKVLFSADAFGKFGALDRGGDWDCEARRYYFGIVGKYGVQVQGLLKKAAGLAISTICPLHGPVLQGDLRHYLGQYQTWSSYGVESPGIVIAYTSVYGHTRAAAEQLAEMLRERGCPKVVLTDLARSDMWEALEDAFRYGTLVLASTTYNGTVFPTMKSFIQNLVEHGYQKRRIAFIENGSWAPMAAKAMQSLLEGAKNLSFLAPVVQLRGGMQAESRAQLEQLAAALLAE